MGAEMPKQYIPLAGMPLVLHTLKAFEALHQVGQCVLVVAPSDTWIDEVIKTRPKGKFTVSRTGGEVRSQTVIAGLLALKELGAGVDDWVLVHDAARCLITAELIQHLIDSCKNDGVGGLLAIPLADTLKSEFDGRVDGTVNRSCKWLAQTPQMFRWQMLFNALTDAKHEVTDESSAIEHQGISPKLVHGASFNFKVTFPQDVILAEALLADRQKMEIQNHDTH